MGASRRPLNSIFSNDRVEFGQPHAVFRKMISVCGDFRIMVNPNSHAQPRDGSGGQSQRGHCGLCELCVFMWSKTASAWGDFVFEASSDKDKARMAEAASTFFGDINRMIVEYMILKFARSPTLRGISGNTIAFLLQHYDFSADPAKAQRLAQLDGRLQAFKRKLLPARNKLTSPRRCIATLSWRPTLPAARHRANGTSFGSICKTCGLHHLREGVRHAVLRERRRHVVGCRGATQGVEAWPPLRSVGQDAFFSLTTDAPIWPFVI